jgi:protein O-mannosyl-transferase
MNAVFKKIGSWPYTISHAWAVGLLSLLTLILYVPTLHYGFVFDDFPTILEYPHFHTSGWSAMIFSSSRWIARMLHRLGFLISGSQPYGFRLVNLVLHLATGLLVYALVVVVCKQLKQEWFAKRSGLVALLTAGLFLLHPVQTQTATYMTQMSTEGVAAFFVVLVALLFALTVLSKDLVRKALWCIATLATAYVGCGSKEIIVVLPGLVLLVDALLLAQVDVKAFLRRIPLHLALAGVMFVGLGRVGMHVKRVISEAPKVELPNNRGNIVTQSFTETIKPNLYRWSQPKILLHYLRIFFWPSGLCFEYPIKIVTSPTAADVIFPLLFWAMLAAGLIFLMVQRTLLPVVFGVVWFLAVMLPRAITPSQELVCDYKTYIASIGIMLILAVLIIYVLERVATLVKTTLREPAMAGGLVAFAMVAMMSSHVRNFVWSDEQVFWEDVVTKVPQRARAYNNLAVAHLVKNDVEKAVSLFEKAVEVDNFYGEPHVNLALIAQRQGNRAKAAEHYDKALAIGEMHPQLFYNLGIFNASCGDQALAEQAFRKAIEIRDFYPPARYELAQLLQAQKRYKEVVALCEDTFKQKAVGEYAFLHIYATALFEMNDFVRATGPLKHLNQQDPKVAFMLACCLYEQNHYADAIKHFEVAYRVNRHDIGVAYNFGQALMRGEQYERALEMFGRCNNVVEQLPYVPFFKACCLQGLDRKGEAKTLLTKVVETTKNVVVKNDAQALLKTI